MFSLLAIIIGLIAVTALAMSAISSWINSSKSRSSTHAELVKQRLSNGEYKVVVGIFQNSHRQAVTAWQAESLDSELEQEFGYSNYATIYL